LTLATDFWPVTPAGNGIGYWGYPGGTPPQPQWTSVPNFINQTGSLSVDILTTYITPTTGCTCVLNDPTGKVQSSIFSQPVETGIAGNMIVPLATPSQSIPTGKLVLLQWEPNPYNSPSGTLVSNLNSMGALTGYTAINPATAQLCLQSTANSSGFQMEGPVVGGYMSSAELGTSPDGKYSGFPNYSLGGVLPSVFSGSSFYQSMLLQIPVATASMGGLAYWLADARFAGPGGIFVSLGVKIFPGVGETNQPVGISYDSPSGTYQINCPLGGSGTGAGLYVTPLPHSTLSTGTPWSGFLPFSWVTTQAQFQAALIAINAASVGPAISTDPTQYTLQTVHGNAELAYTGNGNDSGGIATLGWSMQQWRVWTGTTGFAFDGTYLTYDGVTVAPEVSGLYFTATLTSSGLSANSNTFSVRGNGSGVTDPYPPTIPVGISATNILTTSALVQGLPSSDPNPAGYLWGGMQQYNVTVSGIGTQVVSSAAGNKPTLTFADIGTQTSVFTQTGSSVTITTTALDPSYPLTDALAFAYQQINSAYCVLTFQISGFNPANPYSNVGIQARVSLANNSAFVGMQCTSFSGGKGVSSYYRPSTGGNSTVLQTVANSGPTTLILIKNGSSYTFFNGSTPVGTLTQNMGNALYVGFTGNTNAGVSITATLTQTNIQTLANWTLTLSNLIPNTHYNVTATAQDTDLNISAASTTYSFTTAQQATGAYKFTPGHWIELDQNNSGTNGANWLSRINNAKAMGFVGVFIIVNLRQLMQGTSLNNVVYRFGTLGPNGGGFNLVDWFLTACKNAGIQFELGWEDRQFVAQTFSGTPTAATFGVLPDLYNTANGGGLGFNYAPSGTQWDGELAMIAQVDQSFNTTIILAMHNAYAAQYDANLTFEGIRGPETAVAGSSGINDQNYANQIVSFFNQVRGTGGFKASEVGISPNYFGSNAQMQAIFAAMKANACCGLGPDDSPGLTQLTSNMVHNGNIGGTSYVNVLPCINEMQYPDATGQWGNYTPQQYYNFAFNGALANGGSTKPNKMFWFDNTTGSGVSIAQVSAAIPSMPLNTQLPSVYGQVEFQYFISSTGNDSNSGTSPSQAWAITSLATTGGNATNFALMAGASVGLIGGNYDVSGFSSGGQVGTAALLLKIPPGTAGNPTYIASCNSAGVYSPGLAVLNGAPTGGGTLTPYPIIGMNTQYGAGNVCYCTLDGIVVQNISNPSSTGQVYGAISFYMSGNTVAGSGPQILNCQISNITGTAAAEGDNVLGISLECVNGALVHNCLIHGMQNAQATHNAACIQLYSNINTVIEYCTLYNANTAIYDKYELNGHGPNQGTIARYNYIYQMNGSDGGPFTGWENAQATHPSSSTALTPYQIHHNIIDLGSQVKALLQADLGTLYYPTNTTYQAVPSTVNCFNNTVSMAGAINGGWVINEYQSSAPLGFWNNVFISTASVGGLGASTCAIANIGTMDYNCWAANSTWNNNPVGSQYTTLATWQGVSGKDAHSIVGPPSFVGGAGNNPANFVPASNSPLLGKGRVGGVSTGTVCNMGAWDGTVTQIGYSP